MRRFCACDEPPYICPYDDMHSGYMNSCEYWCGDDEPEDNWEDFDPDNDNN